MKISTRIIREDIESSFGSIAYPIYQTSAFMLPQGEKYRYTRENNPTVEQLSNKIADLEDTDSGTSFASGMGAITSTLLTLLKPNSRMVIHRDVFSRTFKFSTDFLRKWNVKVDVADPGTENIIEKINQYTDVVLVEGITNPILRVNDLELISKKAKEEGAVLVVDSTFATPIVQKPITLGADIVVHSASKYLAGHNDVIAGVAVGKADHIQEIDQTRRNLGAALDPHAAFLVLRGLKTLKVRMEAINRTAMATALFLKDQKRVNRVHYPGLEEHPDHYVAQKILNGFGGVVSFEVNGGSKEALAFISALKLITPANTLGGVNSTISHPATMSHRGLSPEEKQKAGISDSLIRLSIGLEDSQDIFEDLRNGLEKKHHSK